MHAGEGFEDPMVSAVVLKMKGLLEVEEVLIMGARSMCQENDLQ